MALNALTSAVNEHLTIDVWREDMEPNVAREVITFKPSWTVAELKNHLKMVTGLGINELVVLFQDHQLTDNIRISGDELRILRQHGGFRLRKRTQACGNKRLFSKGIRGLPAFLARTFGMLTGDGRPIEMYIPPPPPPPPPPPAMQSVQFYPPEFNNIIYDSSLALAAEAEDWNATESPISLVQQDNISASSPPPPPATSSPVSPVGVKRKAEDGKEFEEVQQENVPPNGDTFMIMTPGLLNTDTSSLLPVTSFVSMSPMPVEPSSISVASLPPRKRHGHHKPPNPDFTPLSSHLELTSFPLPSPFPLFFPAETTGDLALARSALPHVLDAECRDTSAFEHLHHHHHHHLDGGETAVVTPPPMLPSPPPTDDCVREGEECCAEVRWDGRVASPEEEVGRKEWSGVAVEVGGVRGDAAN
ncbi:hypothetical protein BC829DRAFT_436562 [Chytridium lagenaria]|nr:hypothetical protein BC829DRAFT_436562 [Chytridium lagenaria]